MAEFCLWVKIKLKARNFIVVGRPPMGDYLQLYVARADRVWVCLDSVGVAADFKFA